MSLPLPDPRDAKQTAAATMTSGRFHDVVMSSSRLLHGDAPSADDKRALQWALRLLDAAAATDVMFTMPSSQQLATSGGQVSALRRAARSSESDVALDRLRDGLKAALRGKRDDEVLQSVASLRALFSGASRLALQAEVQKQRDRESLSWPQPLTASLL